MSGNRCAICRNVLVIDPTDKDPESVVGEECHIVSSSPKGPRYDNNCPIPDIDNIDNIILLCRVHHKMIDDQTKEYTVDKLRKIKEVHENWVFESLNKKEHKPVRILRKKEDIAEYLDKLETGKDVINIISNSYALLYDSDEPKTKNESELIGDFISIVQEYGDMWSEMNASYQMNIIYNLKEMLDRLKDAGLLVFGVLETRYIEGGIDDKPSKFPVAILQINRSTNPEIIYRSADNLNNKPCVRNPENKD